MYKKSEKQCKKKIKSSHYSSILFIVFHSTIFMMNRCVSVPLLVVTYVALLVVTGNYDVIADIFK